MIGEKINQYKILEKIGEGAMGEVYKAHDPVLNRFVAVKTRAAAEYLKYYSATQTFSNALSPVQAASVLAARRPLGPAECSDAA